MMSINKLVIALAVAGLLMVTACDSVLDTEPKQSISEEIALEGDANVKAILAGAYDNLSDDDVLGGSLIYAPDLYGASTELTWSGTFEQPRQIFNKTILVDNSFISATWIDGFETINIANNVLDGIDQVLEADQDRVRGEALFIRGLVQFELVRLFGPAYNDGDPNTNLGIPVITEPTRAIDETSEVPRNSVQEVYQQILSDLTTARDLLPETNGFFADTYAASAILSRVHLTMGEYADARDEAHRVISSQNYSLLTNYTDVFNRSENSTEDIFAMQFTDQDNPVYPPHSFYASTGNNGRGDVDIQPAHLNEYEAGDERLNQFYVDGEGVIRSGKYVDQFANVQVVRLAEMYLTRAEGNLHEQTSVGNDPVDDVNIVRDRVGLTPLGSVDEDAILKERKLELMFEGHLLHDLKRTEQAVGSYSWNDSRLIYPIPQREMDANPNMVQNSFYN